MEKSWKVMQNPKIGYDGNKRWYVNGKPHRLDGPAIEHKSGLKLWYVNGKKHRIDGPAIIFKDGSYAWFVNDIDVSGPLELLKHGAKLEDIAEYLTPREIALCRIL